jgi:predicted phosphate transport protein (TIGR00153 family)
MEIATDLFRESPIQPFQKHMKAVRECVKLVRPMFETLCPEDFDRLHALTKDVFKTEHDADQIKTQIRQTIPSTYILPVSRGDLLGYLKAQDNMADAAEDVAVLLTLKRLSLPPSLREQTMQYVDTVLDVCQCAYALTDQFQTVVDEGFSGDGVERLLGQVARIEKGEWESDCAQYKLSQALFALEDELSAVDIMLWFQVFKVLGDLADYAEDVAAQVRRMVTSR